VEEMRNAYKIPVGKPERKRPLGRLDMDGEIILSGCQNDKIGGCGLCSSGTIKKLWRTVVDAEVKFTVA
jgi:hypothetical protein